MPTSKSTHTPRPWINLGNRVDVDIADGLSGICEMSDWMSKEEMEANARLIASAPELLEAMKKAVKFISSGTKPYDLLWDAINKAEGREG